MAMLEKIEQQLRQAFSVNELIVEDESEAHRGHSGFQEGGESHFRVVLAATEFSEMSRIARHRAVHAALGDEIIGKIHALELELR